MIGTLDVVNIVVIKLLPHRKFHGVGGKRSALRWLQWPISAGSPCSAAGVSGCPEFMARTAAACRDVICREQRVDQHLAVSILYSELGSVAEDLFAIAGGDAGSFNRRHVHGMQ